MSFSVFRQKHCHSGDHPPLFNPVVGGQDHQTGRDQTYRFQLDFGSFVHGLNKIPEGFIHIAPLDLHGGGDFPILFVKFLGQ